MKRSPTTYKNIGRLRMVHNSKKKRVMGKSKSNNRFTKKKTRRRKKKHNNLFHPAGEKEINNYRNRVSQIRYLRDNNGREIVGTSRRRISSPR